jgi:transcriptional regulator with XRE-family HTH domain
MGQSEEFLQKEDTITLAEIIGENLRQLRAEQDKTETITIGWGARQGEVVGAWGQEGLREQLRRYGIKWNHTKMSDIENGHNEPTATELFKLAHLYKKPVWTFYVPRVEWIEAQIEEPGLEMPAYYIISEHLTRPAFENPSLFSTNMLSSTYATLGDIEGIDRTVVKALRAASG